MCDTSSGCESLALRSDYNAAKSPLRGDGEGGYGFYIWMENPKFNRENLQDQGLGSPIRTIYRTGIEVRTRGKNGGTRIFVAVLVLSNSCTFTNLQK